MDNLGGGRGGEGKAEPATVTRHHHLVLLCFLSFFSFLCKGDPYPVNSAQRKLGVEDFLCMG
jgi:hypothetical protein